MEYNLSDVTLIIVVGTILLLSLGAFVTVLLFSYKNRYLTYQQNLSNLKESYNRELLLAQIEIQNQTLQQVAGELHDNIGQLLTLVIIRLNSLEDEAAQSQNQQSVRQTRDLVESIIMDVRALSKTLDYNTVRRFGLLPSLTLELERIQRTGHIHTQLLTTGEVYSLGEQAETVLVRMAQESINNVLKHAKAQNLVVSTKYTPDSFTLTIADDGRGFSVDDANARTFEQAGAGLTNLQRRAGLLGGVCTIVSQPGLGTRIEINLPHD